jgi:hypothetical protein
MSVPQGVQVDPLDRGSVALASDEAAPPCGETPTGMITLVSGVVVPACSGGVTTGCTTVTTRVMGTISSNRPSPTCSTAGGTTSATDSSICATAMPVGGYSMTIVGTP